MSQFQLLLLLSEVRDLEGSVVASYVILAEESKTCYPPASRVCIKPGGNSSKAARFGNQGQGIDGVATNQSMVLPLTEYLKERRTAEGADKCMAPTCGRRKDLMSQR